jgi:type I restriction-modification system DNA methylase subunit
MTQKQLEDYLWGAANIMRGMIDAADREKRNVEHS